MPQGVGRESDKSDIPVQQPEGLGRLIRVGLGWSLLNNMLGRAGTMLAGIVLARLLVPEDYGVFAVALVVLNALLSMNELGVSLAIVRWPGDVRRVAPTVATLALVSSLTLYALCFALAPAVASSLNAPEATGVLRLLCLSVLLDAVSAVPSGFLTREFRQRQRLVADLLGLTVSTSLSIGLAVAGFGAWSLAWGALAGSLVVAVAVLRCSPYRLRFGFDQREVRPLLAFGAPLAGSSLLLFAMLNAAYVVVGVSLDTTALGLYLLAFNLSSWPVNMLSTAVRRVSLAGFSRLQDDPVALRAGFVRSCTLLAAATLPICLLLGLLAEPLIRVVYGDRWSGAAPALAFLAVVAALRVILELAYDFLVGLGRSRTIFLLQAAWVAAAVPAMILGAQLDGLRGVAAAQAVVASAIVLPAFAAVLQRAGVPLSAVARGLVRPGLGAAAVVASVAASRQAFDSDLLHVLVGGSLGVCVYTAVLLPAYAKDFARARRGTAHATTS